MAYHIMSISRYLDDILDTKAMPYNLRNDSIVNLSKFNFINHVKYSILYDGAALWDALDGMSANAKSVVDFKTMIKT